MDDAPLPQRAQFKKRNLPKDSSNTIRSKESGCDAHSYGSKRCDSDPPKSQDSKDAAYSSHESAEVQASSPSVLDPIHAAAAPYRPCSPSSTAHTSSTAAAERSPPPSIPVQYEYLDHTADVQFHAWGATLAEAFEQMVVCMFSYMTDIETVEELGEPLTVEVSGHDMQSLLYALMDEFLYQFCVEGFVARRVTVVSLDRQEFKIRATGFGETFRPRVKHPQGTEIKAITYSAMQIHEPVEGADAEAYVIVDI